MSNQELEDTFSVLNYIINRASKYEIFITACTSAAKGLEYFCDGKTDFLGFKPDFTDFSMDVEEIVRKQKHQVHAALMSVEKKFDIGPGITLALSLAARLIDRHRSNLGKKKGDLHTAIGDYTHGS